MGCGGGKEKRPTKAEDIKKGPTKGPQKQQTVDAKIILVGESDVGKTTLIKMFMQSM